VVREAVEETLNQLLEAEADGLCGARRYERSAERVDTRAGSYERQLHTKAGEVTLKVPKLRSLPFETAIIERYKRRESSVEEALIEMYLAGVSVRRVEDITEARWGTKVSASLVSELNQKIYVQIEAPRRGEYAYVYVDGMWLKRSWGGEVKNVSVLIAVGVNAEGYREVLAVAEGIHAQEDLEAARAEAAAAVVSKLREMKLKTAAEIVESGVEETLSYMSFPREHWRNLRTNNPLERVIREIRRRTRVVGSFPDGQSALMLVAARLRHIAGTKWGTKRYMDMKRLREASADAEAATAA
jgi:transposase-like protein